MMKKKTVLLVVLIGIITFVGLNFLVQFIMDVRLSQVTGYDTNSIEYAIAKHFDLLKYPNTEFDYILDDEIVFAITQEPNQTSRSAAFWQSSNGEYQVYPREIIATGESMYSLGIGDSLDGASLFYAENGKCYFDFRLEGYRLMDSSQNYSEAIDIDTVRVYDNFRQELKHIDGEKARYYYAVFDKCPEDWKVYMEYEGKEILLLSAANKTKL